MEKGIYDSSDGFVIVEIGKKVTMGISLAKQGEAKVSYVGFGDKYQGATKEQKVALHFNDTESIDTLIECLGYIKSYIQGVPIEDFDKKLEGCIYRFNTNCRE